MKKKMNKTVRQKKLLLAIAVALLVAVGGTLAYHTSRGAFNNNFMLGYWQNETTEVFDSPTWKTCDEIPKIVIGKNTGTVPAVARLSYDEYWKMIGSTSTSHDTELPLLDGDNDPIAYVNLQNQADWEDGGDGWYYYKYVLWPGEETNSMFKSVTLNCKNNFGGANDDCTVEGNTRSCTNNTRSEYEDATFHVFVTLQYLQSDKCNEVWGHCAEDDHYHAKCDSNILYDHIACLTNGTDEDINFNSGIESGLVDGKGVNTVYAHRDDYYQTHYYRGDFVDNHVKFAGYCWLIVRTTSTGGVKLIYNGEPNGDKCRDINSDPESLYAFIEVNGKRSFPYNTFAATSASRGGDSYAMSPHMYGYMYKPSSVVVVSSFNNSNSQIKVGSSVVWNGRQYELQNVQDSWWTDAEHRYVCPDGASTSCNKALFNMKAGSSMYFQLENGESYNDMVHANVADSEAKTTVDTWFRTHMLSSLGKLEDTPFCNDRSFDYEHPDTSRNSYAWSELNAFTRLHTNKTPTIDCSDARDAFSVSPENGNGKLTYPVALLTGDEALLTAVNGIGSEHGFLYPSSYAMLREDTTHDHHSWTMTPATVSSNHEFAWSTYMFWYLATGSQGYVEYGSLRPVISLKKGMKYTNGDGSRDNPFVIE